MILPLLLIAGGAVVAVAAIKAWSEPPVPVHEPDLPPVPGSTHYRLVDAILPQLKESASASGIPLGLMVGWVARESGGRLGELTSLDERGYYQLIPDESKSLGLDHQRLSTDSAYSISSGPPLIGKYMKKADEYGVAPRGSSYYWRLVKLGHTMGSGDVKKLIDGAVSDGQAGSWESLKAYALSGKAKTKHSPAKWFPLVDKVYETGQPFGFGSEQIVGGGETASADCEALGRAIESSCRGGSLAEKQAVGWACRNRAARLGLSVSQLLAPSGTYGPRGIEGRDFVSTASPASDESAKVARAVLVQPEEADPTQNAIDFWKPGQQAQLRAINETQGLVGASEEDVRQAFAACGLVVCGVIGDVELLCAPA